VAENYRARLQIDQFFKEEWGNFDDKATRTASRGTMMMVAMVRLIMMVMMMMMMMMMMVMMMVMMIMQPVTSYR
jgi:hypothetical protein